MYKGRERTPENKLSEGIEKLEMSLFLSERGLSSVDDLPIDVMDRAREIASLDEFDNIGTVKELLVTELQIFKLSEQGLSEDELAEVVEDSLTKVAKILLSDSTHVSNDQEAHLIIRNALKKSPKGINFTDTLLESIKDRKEIR